MRILAITPIHVGTKELSRRQQRYDKLSPKGVEVVVRDLPEDAPRALDTDDDIRASERYVAAELTHAGGDYNIVMPDCVLDPAYVPAGVNESFRGVLHESVTSIARSGERFGVVVRNEAIAREIYRRIAEYGTDDALVDVYVMDLPFDAVTDHAMWNAAMVDAVRRLKERGAGVVINGCSAVDVAEEDLGVRVIDPVKEALAQFVRHQHG